MAEANPTSPPTPATPRIIAMMNQKGGVGKTTTTVNLAAALALRGQRVLLIDLDPQAHLTLHVGINPDDLEYSVYQLLTDPNVSALQVLREVGDNLACLPAEVNLAGAEAELAHLASAGQAQRVLRDKLAPILFPKDDPSSPSSGKEPGQGAAAPDNPPTLFDYVMIDCPPSLGLLTLNGLALAGEVFVPMQTHFLALQGLSKLLSTVQMVSGSINPRLQVTGLILCLYEKQTVLAGEVMADVQNFLEAARTMDVPWRNARVLQPPIRRNIKLAECPSFGRTIFDYAPLCPGAADYRALAENVLNM